MKNDGLTIIEVMIAMMLFGIVLATFTTAVTSNFSLTQRVSQDVQATRVLNYFVRQVAAGQPTLLAVADAPLTWDYNSLAAAFPTLTDADAYKNLNDYSLAITNSGPIALGGATAVNYTIQVCFTQSTERCLSADTVSGAPLPAAGTRPPLPGIN